MLSEAMTIMLDQEVCCVSFPVSVGQCFREITRQVSEGKSRDGLHSMSACICVRPNVSAHLIMMMKSLNGTLPATVLQ